MCSVRVKIVNYNGTVLQQANQVIETPNSVLDHDHLCVLYDRDEDLPRKCTGLARSAAAAGFRYIYVIDNAVCSNISARLGEEVKNGTVVNAEELLGPQSSPVCVTTLVKMLRKRGEQACADGSRGLLVLFDMSWMLVSPSGLANQGELEAALHELAGSSSVRIVCLYNRSLFPANILLDALRTHPAVFDGSVDHANPHFLPPAVFLSGDAQKKLDWWLDMLGGPHSHVADGTIRAKNAGLPVAAALRSGRKPVREKAERSRSRGGGGAMREADPELATGAVNRWKIRCLGELGVYRHDGSPVEWNHCSGATNKTKTLFAYLLQKGPKGASVEETADLLWPEAKDLSQSLNRLYHTVHCLRIALSPQLSSSRGSPYVVSHTKRYYLTLPEATWIDVPVFEQFCRQGEKLLNDGDLEQSLLCHLAAERLYSGSLFADIPTEYIEDRERDWCWSRRFWIEAVYVKMLAYIATIHRRRGDIKMALQYCERGLKIDPCSEKAHQEAMRTYHLIGRGDALERQYRLCRESLKRFEERQPSAETVSLARQLMANG